MLFLTFNAPRDFISDTAWITMTTAPSVGMHCLVFSWMARWPMPRKLHWVVCLASAWGACFATAWLLSATVLKGPLGLLIAIGEMLVAAALMPRARGAAVVPRIPNTEIAVRMLAALVIAAIIMLGAETFGSRISGILLSFPITASVLPVFTLYLYGADATVRLLSGFVVGLLGFISYFFAFALLVNPLGLVPAFFGGVLASLVAVSAILGAQAAWRGRRTGRAA
jgi:hypothetical protein